MTKDEHAALPAFLENEARNILRMGAVAAHEAVPVAGLLFSAAATISELRERLASAEKEIAKHAAAPGEDDDAPAPAAPRPRRGRPPKDGAAPPALTAVPAEVPPPVGPAS